jgi:hypothetical protein
MEVIRNTSVREVFDSVDITTMVEEAILTDMEI